MGKFKVVCCLRCRTWQVVTASKTFRCRFCGYTTELKRLNVFYESDDALKASQYVKLVKEGKIRPF